MTRCLTEDGRRLLDEVSDANTFWTRLRGLLGRHELPQHQGLLIQPCHSVHTLGMRFAIGVLFLDREQRVLFQIQEMPPGRFSPIVRGARQVLELHPAQLARCPVQLGERLSFVASAC